MAFDWQAFATAFLEGQTRDIRERKGEAKEYEERQRELAEQNNVLRARREATARQAAQLGQNAMALMDPGIPQATKEAMVANAMASGPAGIQTFYNQLQAAANQRGAGRTLSIDDVNAVVQMPANLPPVNMNLVDFAMQTYGARLPAGAVTVPEQQDRSLVADIFGFGAKEDVQRKLATETSYGGMTIAEINQLANMSDYNALYDNAWMTLSETPYLTAEQATGFVANFTTTITSFKNSNEAETIRTDAIREYMDPNKTPEVQAKIEEFKSKNPTLTGENAAREYANEQVQFQANLLSEDMVLGMLYEYGPAFIDNPIVSNVLIRNFGTPYVDTWRESIGLDPITLEPEGKVEAEAGGRQEDVTPPEPTVEPLQSTEEPAAQEGKYPTAQPLDEQGRAVVEKELSGFAVFSDAEDKYTDLYTREQWQAMTRKDRRERGLPESALGAMNFYFRDDIDEMLQSSMDNLRIVRNPTEEEYRVTIRGRVGAYNVTKDQLALISESYLTGTQPVVTIRPYEEGEDKGRSISNSRITTILSGQ